jgi:hypothetical protein
MGEETTMSGNDVDYIGLDWQGVREAVHKAVDDAVHLWGMERYALFTEGEVALYAGKAASAAAEEAVRVARNAVKTVVGKAVLAWEEAEVASEE